jgi:hypothetical protein
MHAQTKTDNESRGAQEPRDHPKENLRRLHNELVDVMRGLPLDLAKDAQTVEFLDYAAVWVQRAFYLI